VLKRKISLILFIVAILQTSLVEAQSTTIGSIAENMIAGTGVITRLMVVLCMVVGIGFMIISIHMYRQHRANPKFVPLDRPVMYLVLGLLVFGIPFLGQVFGPTGSVLELDKRKAASSSCSINIDAPLELGNEFDH
jgi:preprotein translocase subunit SecG